MIFSMALKLQLVLSLLSAMALSLRLSLTRLSFIFRETEGSLVHQVIQGNLCNMAKLLFWFLKWSHSVLASELAVSLQLSPADKYYSQ